MDMPEMEIEKPKTEWVYITQERPDVGTIAPVWDGDYLYYAIFSQKHDYQYWIICSEEKLNLEDCRKEVGEEVYPLEWLRVCQP